MLDRAPMPARPSRLAAGALGAALAVVAACSAGPAQQAPSDTLRAYAAALEQGRVDEAYRLLSNEAKRSMSLEAFRRAVRDNPQDALEIAHALARPSSDPEVTATVTLPSGEELALVLEGGQWRIDAAAVDLYGQSTPRQALLGFLRAYERKRYDVLLRYVPDAEREGAAEGDDVELTVPTGADAGAPAGVDGGAPAPRRTTGREATTLTPEKLRASWEGAQREPISRKVQAIRTALPTATIEETGDAAAMAYGAGGTIAFVREHGAWKIRDF